MPHELQQTTSDARKSSANSPSVKYANIGWKVGIAVGLILTLVYVTSPLNKNRGSLLSWPQNAIIFGLMVASLFICSGIGTAIGKWVEAHQKNNDDHDVV